MAAGSAARRRDGGTDGDFDAWKVRRRRRRKSEEEQIIRTVERRVSNADESSVVNRVKTNLFSAPCYNYNNFFMCDM